MTDWTNLDDLSGDELSEEQLRGILNQIDLDITNLLRDGKLSALKYSVGGAGGRTTDRAANLKALLEARKYYQQLYDALPGWVISEDPQK